MSRIRSTHPGLWTDERFVSVSAFARLFFMGLWNECDDQGTFEWSPLKLKMRLLAADAVDAESLLEELERAGSLLRYQFEGRTYGAVRNFCRFQRPKKPNAVHPLTETVRAFVGTEARTEGDSAQEPVPDLFGSAGEKSPQREEEGGRKESVPAKAGTCRAPRRGARLPQHFDLPEEWAGWAMQRRRWDAESVRAEALLFANYWQSKAGRDGRKLDWFKTWQNWVLVSRRGDGAAEASAPRQLPPEEQAARLEQSADWYEKHDRAEDAADCRRRAARLRATIAATGPPASPRQTRFDGSNSRTPREGKNG